MPRLDGSTTLVNGRRVRVRLPHASDGPGLHRLFERAGLRPDDLLLGRLRRFDPRDRASLVATLLVGRAEEIVGVAAQDRFADHPELVVADPELAPGAGALLEDALREHARRARGVA